MDRIDRDVKKYLLDMKTSNEKKDRWLDQRERTLQTLQKEIETKWEEITEWIRKTDEKERLLTEKEQKLAEKEAKVDEQQKLQDQNAARWDRENNSVQLEARMELERCRNMLQEERQKTARLIKENEIKDEIIEKLEKEKAIVMRQLL